MSKSTPKSMSTSNSSSAAFPSMRLRRMRATEWSRRLMCESVLTSNDLIWTIILSDSPKDRDPVPSMPGVDRVNIDSLIEDAQKAANLGIPALAIFPHINPKYKDSQASEVLNPQGLIPEAIRAVKQAVPDIGIIVDVALDPYTDHGHDGLMQGDKILNDATIDKLAKAALILAEAGADIVAPSDMMDGRIGTIRAALESHNYPDIMIMSYAAKYASGFYGPYRDAIGTASALKGDKRTYQMDPPNSDEALREVALDIAEGADMVMIKPGLPYLDIIRRIKDEFSMPTYAFQVSGEYAMLRAAGDKGWLDYERVMLESLTSLKRAGCDGILTYAAAQIAARLQT